MNRPRAAVAVLSALFIGGALTMMAQPLLQIRKGKRTVSEVCEALRPALQKEMGGPKKFARLTDGGEIVLLGIKSEKRLEVWKQFRQSERHEKILDLPWTATSGKAGPKLKQGDRQIPEGVYELEYLNPNSKYHLSMKVDYPNAFDRARGRADGRSDLGGDIMIHGNQVTIGCIPLGDVAIEKLFLLVADNGMKNTRIIISPIDFRKGEAAPVIEGISWEGDLYPVIEKAMSEFVERSTSDDDEAGKR